MISNIKDKVLKYIYRAICCCLNKENNKILFYSTPDAADNSWHMFIFLANNSIGKKFVWICENPSAVSSRIKQATAGSQNSVLVKKKLSVAAFLHFCTSAYAFTTTGFYPFVVRGYGPLIINLWHGMPIKRIGAFQYGSSPRGLEFDFLISTSSFFSDVIARAYRTSTSRVLPFGLPRNDVLIHYDQTVKDKLLSTFNAAEDQKIIFWLPTFRKSLVRYKHNDAERASFLDDWGTDLITRLNYVAGEAGIILLIKIHPADQLNESVEDPDCSNVKLLTSDAWARVGVELYQALAVSDGLISDISSVLIDYTITKKPIGVTAGALKDYSRGLIPDVAPILDRFHRIDDERDFNSFFELDEQSGVLGDEFYFRYNSQALDQRSAAGSIASFLEIA